MIKPFCISHNAPWLDIICTCAESLSAKICGVGNSVEVPVSCLRIHYEMCAKGSIGQLIIESRIFTYILCFISTFLDCQTHNLVDVGNFHPPISGFVFVLPHLPDGITRITLYIKGDHSVHLLLSPSQVVPDHKHLPFISKRNAK